jgi:hypothetical protein
MSRSNLFLQETSDVTLSCCTFLLELWCTELHFSIHLNTLYRVNNWVTLSEVRDIIDYHSVFLAELSIA